MYKSKHLTESVSVKGMLDFLVKNSNLIGDYELREVYANVIAQKLSNLGKYGSFYANRSRDIESTSHGLTFDISDYTYDQIVAELEKKLGGASSDDMEIKNNYSWAKDVFIGFKPGSKTEFKVNRYYGTDTGIVDILTVLSYAVTKKPERDRKTGFDLVAQYDLKTGFGGKPTAYDQKNIKELGIVLKQFKNGKILVGGLKADALGRLAKMQTVLTGR